MMLVLRPAPMFAWRSHFDRCSVSDGAPLRPVLMPTRCSCFARRICPPGTHTHLASLIRQALMLGLMSMLTWRSCFARCPCLPSAHVHPMSTFRPTLMLAWRSCFARRSREISAAHTVLGPQEPISHDKNRATCMISGLPTRNRAFAGKILTLCIPNRLIASENACMERKSCHR